MSTRKRSDEDFDREIHTHLEIETERLIEEGLSADAARTRARRAFGNITRARERFYEAGRLLWLDHLWQDVRCAIRNAGRYPVAATVAITSLAAGIGATTVTLTIRDVIFHKPPPLYKQPDDLSRIQVGRPDRPIMRLGSPVPAGLYAIWSDALGPTIAASTAPRGLREIRAGDRTGTVPHRATTSDFFSVLGISAELGITLDQVPPGGSSAPAMISYGIWQILFDGQPDVVGRDIWIENQPHTIVGVLPRRFWFADMGSAIWTKLDRQSLPPDEALDLIVRRPAGLSPAMLEARLQGGLEDYARGLPAADRQLRLKVSDIRGTPIGNSVAPFLPYVLGISVLLTLLIACANVAILLIAQWTAREHEIAIRASIGAGRGRIVRLLLTESVLIALCGGALGVCVTFALRGWILQQGGSDLALFDTSIDPRIFIQSALVALVAGLVAGVAPALYETRRLHTNPLRSMGSSDRVRQRLRSGLVVLEITVTIALLVVTAALIDGYRQMTTAERGFATRPLMTARVENPVGVPTAHILETLNRLPGVVVAAASTSVPFGADGPQVSVAADAAGANAVTAERAAITPDFFTALDVSIRAGRPFSHQDSATARIAVVNDALAKKLFPGRDAVGGQIWIANASYDVVGVVTNYLNNPMRRREFDPKVFVLMPIGSNDAARVQFLLRAEGSPSPLVQVIRREVRDAAAGTVVTSAFTLDQIINVAGQEILVGTAPLLPLIAIGTLLTTAGIYGVLAFAITRRSRELALRIAIGASRRDVIRLVTAHTIRLLATGSALGVALTVGLSRVIRASGGAGSILDAPVHVLIAPLLIVLVIGALATWIPSRRAVKIDPAALLRST
jgi:putative ABC transport system permease protein